MPAAKPSSTLVFDAAVYPTRAYAGDVLSQLSGAQIQRMSLSREEASRTTTARIANEGTPPADAPDVTLEAVLTYSSADPATQIDFTLTGASLPTGSKVAVACPDNPDIGIPPTNTRNGRIVSVGFDPELFGSPVNLRLQYWLMGQTPLTGGSLALDISRRTSEANAGDSGVMRDPDSGLPVGLAGKRSTTDVSLRIGQLTWVLQTN